MEYLLTNDLKFAPPIINLSGAFLYLSLTITF